MKKALWLCSWYPHPDSPYEGDFIQRHAKAVSAFIPVTVFYVSQAGPYKNREEDQFITQQTGNVEEKLVLFKFRKTGIRPLDKVLYNIRYYRAYKKAIEKYIEENGLPAIVHVHIPMKAGMIGRWIKRKWNIPYIVSEQSGHYIRGAKDDFFEKPLRHRLNVQKIFKEAMLVTNVSAVIAKTLKVAFRLTDVKVVHNTVDTTLFYYQHHSVSKFRFIHVSTLADHHKNIQGIFNAVANLAQQRNDFEVMIVGPATVKVKEKVASLGLDRVIRFAGEIPYPEVARQMQQASAFILFSRYENFPCVVVEALCSGLPVIATDTGGVSEAVNDTNGLLVQSENEKQLTDAMNKMLNEYQKYDRKAIASNAAAAYSYATIGKAFVDVYRETNKAL
jgi:glycosyltransferase involved in cell wall biosynthesis